MLPRTEPQTAPQQSRMEIEGYRRNRPATHRIRSRRGFHRFRTFVQPLPRTRSTSSISSARGAMWTTRTTCCRRRSSECSSNCIPTTLNIRWANGSTRSPATPLSILRVAGATIQSRSKGPETLTATLPAPDSPTPEEHMITHQNAAQFNCSSAKWLRATGN